MNKINPGNGFENQIRQMYGYVHKIVRGFRFDENTARDVIQEIMIKLYCKSGSFTGKSRLTTWVYAVARNYCIKFKQRVYDKYPLTVDFSIHPINAGLPGNTEQTVLLNELKATVSLYVNELPGYLKLPLIHFYYDNLKYRDIARKMQIPEGTVKSRINTAKNRLQKQLGKYTA